LPSILAVLVASRFPDPDREMVNYNFDGAERRFPVAVVVGRS